jgi:DNA-binding transcriptional MerR regulator/methylmalonyl-CoA mutase cobalamin-binding subunit
LCKLYLYITGTDWVRLPLMSPKDAPRHPIKVVSNRTGLTPEVLRIWEKRYSVVSPGRSSGGQRLYSDQDIERLRLLRALTLGGRRIGELSKQSTPALQRILAEDQRSTPPQRPGPEIPSHSPAEFVGMAVNAVTRMDEQELRSVLARAHSTFSTTDLVEGMVGPLARELGAQWACGEIEVFQEHFATVEIRRLLIRVMESASTRKKDPGILVSTPVGEEHELGAMLVAAVAAAEGWRVVYLGPNLPAADIAEAARSQKVLAVALSAVYSNNTGLEAEFRDLRERLPKKIRLLIGGAALTLSPRALRELGAESVSSLHELPGVLSRIASEG